MALITGTLADSVGNVIDGTIEVSLSVVRPQDTTTYLPILYSFPITAGVISIDVPSSVEIYSWVIKDSQGEVITTFRASVPDEAALNFNSLLPTGFTTITIDTSLARIADFLVNDPVRREKLSPGFTSQGDYSNSSTYFLYDLVNYLGASYYWKDLVPGSGILPTDDTKWQLIASKGDSGSGTTGEDFPYDSNTWDGVLAAPSKNVIRDKIEDLSNVYAPLNDANLTGTPTTSTPTSLDNGLSISNTAFIWDALNPLIDYGADPTQPRVLDLNSILDNSTKIPNTKWVQDVISDRLGSIKVKDIMFGDTSLPNQVGTGNTGSLLTLIGAVSNWVLFEVNNIDYLWYAGYLIMTEDTNTLASNITYVANIPISSYYQKSVNRTFLYQNVSSDIESKLRDEDIARANYAVTSYWDSSFTTPYGISSYYFGLNDFVVTVRTDGVNVNVAPNLKLNVSFLCSNIT